MIFTRILVGICFMMVVCSCSCVSKDQTQILNRVSQIGAYPVSRDRLIKDLNLGGINSECVGGGVRSGYRWYVETWQLPSGHRINAWDSEYVGSNAITAKTIDEILNHPDRTRSYTMPAEFLKVFPASYSRPSFNRVTVTTTRDKIIYDSRDPDKE